MECVDNSINNYNYIPPRPCILGNRIGVDQLRISLPLALLVPCHVK